MIHYTTEGEGHPLLLLHGFPNDGRAWHTISPELAKYYKLIIPDLPGAGNSALPETPLSIHYMAKAVAELLDREQADKVVVAGHSMGGYVAMELASLFPQRVKGLSMVHSLASADSESKKENRKKSIALIQKGPAEKRMFLKGMAQNLFAAEFARQNPDAVHQVVDNGDRLSSDALAAFYTAIMERTDKLEFLKQAAFPVQWIIGEEDTATTMEDMLKQCSIAPVNDVVIYPACGHMSFAELPDRLIGDLVRFGQFCYT